MGVTGGQLTYDARAPREHSVRVLTNPEFCWQATGLCKPLVTMLTRHGVERVQKRAPSSAVYRPEMVGDDGTAVSLQQPFPVRRPPRR